MSAGKGYSTPGRIMIEILPSIRKQIQVIVTRTCDNPEVVDLEEAVLRELVLLWPGVIIRRGSSETQTVTREMIRRKRGGPAGTPEDQKMKIVRGWLKVQGRINQEIYSRSQGVAPSTLRRWMRQLRQEDKL